MKLKILTLVMLLNASDICAQNVIWQAGFSDITNLLDEKGKQSNGFSIEPEEKPRINIPGTPGSYAPYEGDFNGAYQRLARDAALRYNIPQDIFLRLVHQESRWNINATSHKGAIGLAQLMPVTARLLGVNPHDPKQNLNGGAKYLAQQYRDFGTWELALAAYNAGPAAVHRYNGVPPYDETQNYVRTILGQAYNYN